MLGVGYEFKSLEAQARALPPMPERDHHTCVEMTANDGIIALLLTAHVFLTFVSFRRVAGVLESESRAVLCLLGAWLGALPIPLDWDRPWQV